VDPIRLIRHKAELQGTCYFELLPGRYRGQCWNDGSVFLAEDVFGLVEPIFTRHEPRFDHHSFVEITRLTWEKIIADFDRLAELAKTAKDIGELRGCVGFLFAPTEREFATDFRANAEALSRMAKELSSWLMEQLEWYKVVSVLGI